MMTTVALHKRAFTRAAGVSPPWCAETRLQGRYRKPSEDCRRRVGECHCSHDHPTTGADADTPPFPWRQELRLQSRSPNHGGFTPPAPVLRECTPAGDLAFPLHNRCRSTGGLRPPLLALLQRPPAGIMTTVALHKRAFTRAMTVSPPRRGMALNQLLATSTCKAEASGTGLAQMVRLRKFALRQFHR
jgi:hypothetical protein